MIVLFGTNRSAPSDKVGPVIGPPIRIVKLCDASTRPGQHAIMQQLADDHRRDEQQDGRQVHR